MVQRHFANERIAALLEDRRIRSQDEEAHRAVYQQKIDELTQRLKQTELALQRTTKDYILGAFSQPCSDTPPGVILTSCTPWVSDQQ